MITPEEAKKRFSEGKYVAGMEQQPDFVVSSKSDMNSGDNIFLTIDIEDLLNQKIKLKDYAVNNKLDSLYFILLISPTYDGKGVNWTEKKELKRKNKWLYLHIRINYEKFITANKQEALRMMAEEIIRGTDKFLRNEKDFDYERFHADLLELFLKEGILK